MGNMLSSVVGGGQQQSSGMQQAPRAQEQISNPMSGAPPIGGMNMTMQNPNQQPQNFGSNPTNALSNIGRRF